MPAVKTIHQIIKTTKEKNNKKKTKYQNNNHIQNFLTMKSFAFHFECYDHFFLFFGIGRRLSMPDRLAVLRKLLLFFFSSKFAKEKKKKQQT